MEAPKKFFKSAHPFVKVLLAISVTSAAVVINKMFYAPYRRKQQLLMAESYASVLYEPDEDESERSS